MFSALDADGQCVDRLGVLEEVAQGARGAVGFHAADDAARVGDAGEDVFIRVED